MVIMRADRIYNTTQVPAEKGLPGFLASSIRKRTAMGSTEITHFHVEDPHSSSVTWGWLSNGNQAMYLASSKSPRRLVVYDGDSRRIIATLFPSAEVASRALRAGQKWLADSGGKERNRA